MTEKARLSATVDAANLEAANRAFREGRAASVSSWVNEAMRRQAEHDRRLCALEELIASHEAEYGDISDEDMEAAARHARERAVVVRGASKRSRATTRR